LQIAISCKGINGIRLKQNLPKARRNAATQVDSRPSFLPTPIPLVSAQIANTYVLKIEHGAKQVSKRKPRSVSFNTAQLAAARNVLAWESNAKHYTKLNLCISQ